MPLLHDFFRPRSEHALTPHAMPLHRLTLGLAGLVALAVLAGRAVSEDAAPRLARRSPAADPLVREGESLSRAERELLQAIENAGKGMG